MTKEDILKKYENKEVKNLTEVMHWVKTMTVALDNPSRYKKGDVFISEGTNGHKKRPYVIIKQIKDIVIAIPSTSTKDDLSIHHFQSRFFGNGYFSKQLTTLKTSQIDGDFKGILDNNANVNIAFKLIKEHFNNI